MHFSYFTWETMRFSLKKPHKWQYETELITSSTQNATETSQVTEHRVRCQLHCHILPPHRATGGTKERRPPARWIPPRNGRLPKFEGDFLVQRFTSGNIFSETLYFLWEVFDTIAVSFNTKNPSTNSQDQSRHGQLTKRNGVFFVQKYVAGKIFPISSFYNKFLTVRQTLGWGGTYLP